MNEYTKKALPKDRILEAMHDAQKTQADLVRETGLNKSTISRYLSGEVEPRHEATHKLAKALAVSEMWLFGYDVPKFRSDEQKKTDQLAKLIGRMRTDPAFFGMVEKLARVSPEQQESIDKLLAGLLGE